MKEILEAYKELFRALYLNKISEWYEGLEF